GGGPYTFNCGGTNTITLTNTIVVSKNTILDGTGQTLAISGGNLVRLFTVNPGVKCTLMNLALISGEDSGTSGTNGAPGLSGSGGGGAIYNAAAGTIVAYDCTFASNRVSGASGGDGGNGTGLGSNGANGPPGAGLCGGIYNEGGNLTLLFSTFNGNGASGANGGNGTAGAGEAYGSGGTPGSAASGGAIFNSAGTLAATNCTFFGNFVAGGNGGNGGDGGTFGFGGNGGNGGDGGAGNGGGVFNTANGQASVDNCTISHSSAQGGACDISGVAGSLVSQAGQTGGPGKNFGGGIANDTGTTRLKNTLLG